MVSTKSTRPWTSQWKTLVNERMTNIATKDGVKSSRKMVMARRVSTTAWEILSLILSTSLSLRVPRKMCVRSLYMDKERAKPRLPMTAVESLELAK